MKVEQVSRSLNSEHLRATAGTHSAENVMARNLKRYLAAYVTHRVPHIFVPVVKLDREFSGRAEEGRVWGAQSHVEPIIRFIVPATPLDMHCHCYRDMPDLHVGY